MLAVLYRWQVKPDMDAQFVEGWLRVTRAIAAECGSYGSRLHRSDDGSWFGYARWPDAATRDRCQHHEAEGLRLMTDAADLLEQLPADIVEDLLREPAATDRPPGVTGAGS